MGFKKDMTHNPGNDTIVGNYHQSVRTGPRNNVYLPSQDQMIINFCLFVYGSILCSPEEKEKYSKYSTEWMDNLQELPTQ